MIQAALERHGGNRTAAAKELGINPSTLWRKLQRV
jgi:transcriptional regulator with PAS, ATPase and Fis domain